VSRGSAADLAKQGGDAASTFATSVSTTRSDLDNYVEGQILIAPLTGREPPSKSMLMSIDQIRQALSLREQMMRQLAHTYDAFGALANYDAPGEVNSSLVSLSGSINSYADTVSPRSSEGNAVAASEIGATEVATLIMGEEQSRKIKATSTLIRIQLIKIVPLMQKEKSTLQRVQKEIVRGSQQSALALWQLGFAEPTPILGEQVGQLGLTFDPGSYNDRLEKLSKMDRHILESAIGNVVRYRAQRQAELQAAIIDQNVDGLNDLISQHEKLEKGEAVDLAAVTAHISQMRALVDQLSVASTAANSCSSSDGKSSEGSSHGKRKPKP
jgi:hypothetical protein